MKWLILLISFWISIDVSAQIKPSTQQNVNLDSLQKSRPRRSDVKNNSPEQVAKETVEKWNSALKLKDSQSKKILNMLLDYETKLRNIDKGNLSNQEKFKQKDALYQMRKDKMKEILTPEQYRKYLMSFP